MSDNGDLKLLPIPRRIPVVPLIATRNVPNTILHATYRIPVDKVPNLSLIEETLTLKTSAFMGGESEPYTMYRIDNKDRLCVPRMFGIHQFGLPAKDMRVAGKPLSTTVDLEREDIKLREWQETSMPHVLECLRTPPIHGGIVQAECGMGKTFFAIQAILRLGVRAVILTHREVLLQQWLKAVEQFAPHLTTSWLRGQGSPEFAPVDVRVCMIHTLLTGQMSRSNFDDVGLVVVDECHHLCAKTFQHSMGYFRARHVLGLSATPQRSDGNQRGFHWLLGPLIVAATQPKAACIPGVMASMTVRMVRLPRYAELKEYKSVKNKNLVSTWLRRDIAKCRERNTHLAAILHAQIQDGGDGGHRGRHVLMIALQKACLEQVYEILHTEFGMPTTELCIFTGTTTKKGKAMRTKALQTARIVLTTQAMSTEGFNHTILDTVMLTNPLSVANKTLTQAVGRCQRENAGKVQDLQVIDIVDSHADFPQRCYGRIRWYKSQKYTVVRETFGGSSVPVVDDEANDADDGAPSATLHSDFDMDDV